MNSRFVPGPAAAIESPRPVAEAAIVTASYAPDFERCRLLCETVDRFVTGMSRHYILVEERDLAQFRALEGARRAIVSERELLPDWLSPYDDPLSLFRRRIWLSFRTKPLRGWHVQQLRRIAIAAQVAEPVLVYCDSDVAFLKPFDCGAFGRDGQVRLFRRDNAISAGADTQQKTWSANAGRALGIAAPAWSPHDYIATLIAWRRDSVTAMCRHIEAVHARHWIEAVASVRKFSECMLYGRFADEVEGGAHHFHGTEEFCHVHWTGEALSDDEFRAFVAAMTPDQAAIGMQSFIGTDLARIRRLLGA
jgi:hypothetical protein